MKAPDLEIKLQLKPCPICSAWMDGESSQEKVWHFLKSKEAVIIRNTNKITCPVCGYIEKQIQEYPQTALLAWEASSEDSPVPKALETLDTNKLGTLNDSLRSQKQ